MPEKAQTFLSDEGINSRQQASAPDPPSTNSPAKRRGRPPRAAVATRDSTLLSTQSHEGPILTLEMTASSTADTSTSTAVSPKVITAIQPERSVLTPPAPSRKTRAWSARPLERTQQETSALSKAIETATALAAATRLGKRRQEETQPDNVVLNENHAKKPTLKVTTGPPSSANGWNRSSFFPPAPDDPTSISFTEEVISARRKESARVVLKGILSRPPTKTIQAYKTYFKLWKTFCDQRYDGDTTVSPSRMLEFFGKVVFERKVRKVVDPNAGYSGQIGIAAPGAGLRKGRKSARNKETKAMAPTATSAPMIIPAVTPVESGPLPLSSSIEAVSNEVEAVDRNNVNDSSNARNRHEVSNNTCIHDDVRSEDEAGSEVEAEDLSVEEQSSKDATAESLISSITEKNRGMAFDIMQDGNQISIIS